MKIWIVSKSDCFGPDKVLLATTSKEKAELKQTTVYPSKMHEVDLED